MKPTLIISRHGVFKDFDGVTDPKSQIKVISHVRYLLYRLFMWWRWEPVPRLGKRILIRRR